LVVFLAPPWADALDSVSGLDFARTRPPIAEIVADVERVYPSNPILYVVEAHEQLVPESLDALRRRFGRADLRVYDIAAPYGRRAVLFGTNRWPH
jgi:hypothetical protein